MINKKFSIDIYIYFYIASIFLGEINQSLGSYSFYFAAIFIFFKIFNLFIEGKYIIFHKIIFIILILFFYLLFLDTSIHAGVAILNKNFYFTVGSNIFVLILIFDEFAKNIKLRNNALILFFVCLLVSCLLVNNNFFDSIGSDFRVTFVNFNHNEFSFYLLFPLLFLGIFTSTYKNSKNKMKNYFIYFVYFFFYLTMIKAIVYSGSRFPIYIISLIYLSLLVYTFFVRSNGLNNFYIFFISIAYSLYEIFNFTPTYNRIVTPILSNLNQKPDFALNQMSGGRIDIYLESAKILEDKIIFGIGHSNYYLQSAMPHNLVLEIFIAGGIIGITFLLLILYQLLTSIYLNRSNKNKFYLIGSTVIFLFMTTYVNVLSLKIWWIILGFILSETSSGFLRVSLQNAKILKIKSKKNY